MGRGDDPNFDIEHPEYMMCYENDCDDFPAVFPFHPCCWELLVRCIAGGRSGADTAAPLDKDRLYLIMAGLLQSGQRLELDFGDPEPPGDQYWCSMAGEELFAVQPIGGTNIDLLAALVRSTVARDEFRLPPRDAARDSVMHSRTRRDVFSALSYDIVYCITNFLPRSSVRALCCASWSVHTLLRDADEFWRRRIVRELPWFYELVDAITLHEEGGGPRLKLKKLLAWADEVTRPRLYMSGPLMVVANRRRIWGICKQIADIYHGWPDSKIKLAGGY